jgi:hypothetical protein
MQGEQSRAEVEAKLRLSVGEQSLQSHLFADVGHGPPRLPHEAPFQNSRRAFRFENSHPRYPLIRIFPLVGIALALAACAAHRDRAGESARSANGEASAQPGAGTAPSATIQIDYARPGDFVRSVTVTKFSAARIIPINRGGERAATSIVRFDGGAPVWRIEADESVTRKLLTEVPLIAAGKRYALKSVKYGTLPRNFLQTIPDTGPPEPLESGSYYVFAVERDSGSVNFEAVRIDADGTIESYDAQPRAGDSYALCCNVSLDFAASQHP